MLTQLRGLTSYTVPKVDVQLSAVFQSKPGALLSANYSVPNAEAAKSLGRNLSGNATQVTVNLIEPGSLYGDRVNQLDFRVAKILKFGGTRTMIGADMYNATELRRDPDLQQHVLSVTRAPRPGCRRPRC